MLLRPSHAARGTRPSGISQINWASPQAAGLKFWAPIDGRRCAADLVRGSIPTLRGTTTLAAASLGGMTLTLGGAAGDYADYGNLPVTDAPSGNPFYVSCWAKGTGIGAGDDAFVSKWGGGGGGYILWTFQGDVRWGSNEFSSLVQWVGGNALVADGQWHHLIGANYGVLTLELFVDGRSRGAVNGNGVSATSDPFLVGNYASGGGGGLAGQIADVRVVHGVPMTPALAWQLYDPQTRWDLYGQPSSRVFFDVGVAGPAFLARPPVHLNQSVNRASTF